MKQLVVMIKPASSLCNMRCRYCFYANVSDMRAIQNYGIMTETTARHVISNIFEDLDDKDTISFAFQGGEPTLAGLPFFETFVALANAQKNKPTIHWAIQTNGLVIDEEWCRFFKQHNFLVGLSIDGSALTHNQNRVDAEGGGTYIRVMRAKQLFDQNHIEYNVLCVLTNNLARHPQQIWKFLARENIRYVQFIPCLDDLDADHSSPWALQPKRFFRFYHGLYPLWKQRIHDNNAVHIKLFDDIADQFLYGRSSSCGIDGRCHPQFVIEADGSVYPCDFYVLDKHVAGNLAEVSLRKIFENMAASEFWGRRQKLPETCYTCNYLRHCGGGCIRMQDVMYVDQMGYCGYQHLLRECLDDLCQTYISIETTK